MFDLLWRWLPVIFYISYNICSLQCDKNLARSGLVLHWTCILTRRWCDDASMRRCCLKNYIYQFGIKLELCGYSEVTLMFRVKNVYAGMCCAEIINWTNIEELALLCSHFIQVSNNYYFYFSLFYSVADVRITNCCFSTLVFV